MDGDPSWPYGARPNWRDACSDSLRQRNKAMIMQAIRDNSAVPNKAVSAAVDLFEEGFFNEATNEYHYLTMVSDYIQMIPPSSEFLEARAMPLQVDRIQSPSERKKGKELLDEENEPPDVTTGPLEDLCERHNKVTDFLQKLMKFYGEKLLSAHAVQYRPSRQTTHHIVMHRILAYTNFISALVQLKEEMKAYSDDVNEFRQLINSLEELYETKLQWILKFFLSIHNYNLDELPRDELRQYQIWLLSVDIGKLCFSRAEVEEARYRARIHSGAGPSSAPVDLTLRMELPRQKNLGGGRSDSDRNTAPVDLTLRLGLPNQQLLSGHQGDSDRRNLTLQIGLTEQQLQSGRKCGSDRITAPVNLTSMMGHLDDCVAECTGKQKHEQQQLGILSTQQQELPHQQLRPPQLLCLFPLPQQPHQQQQQLIPQAQQPHQQQQQLRLLGPPGLLCLLPPPQQLGLLPPPQRPYQQQQQLRLLHPPRLLCLFPPPQQPHQQQQQLGLLPPPQQPYQQQQQLDLLPPPQQPHQQQQQGSGENQAGISLRKRRYKKKQG